MGRPGLSAADKPLKVRDKRPVVTSIRPVIMRTLGRIFMARHGGNLSSPRSGATNALPLSESSFERVVISLKLSPEEYAGSRELREWVLQNKDHKYVPPELLKAFGLQVNLEP